MPEHLPHIAGKDDRGPFRPTAHRVAGAASPVAGRARVIIVSGPSGAGKGTLIERILPRFPNVEVAVSATTRRRRPGEADGVDYHFLSAEEFERRVAEGAFLEHVEYAGNRYGTLRSEIERILAAGSSPLVEIELEGARAVRRDVPEAASIFIAPPSLAELGRRLERRATDSEGEIAARLATSRLELEAMGEFDHVIVNDDVEAAAQELAATLAEVTGEALDG
ncbi:MAG TPA: guanylate kinase [Miltoncostaeaceae bacterium]|nr:guanylate kinase [Miltoncostaeaceae bacterium]